MAGFVSIAVLSTIALAQSKSNDRLVNAYGERAGLLNLPEAALTDPSEWALRNDPPGTIIWCDLQNPGLNVHPYESLGSWQARADAKAHATVKIGALEVLDSGPTGLITPEARIAARDEVTAQVLTRISATDQIMTALKLRANSLDDGTKVRFATAAAEVQANRRTLRESLKAVRGADADQWNQARSQVADDFNAYTRALHHAEEAVGPSQNI